MKLRYVLSVDDGFDMRTRRGTWQDSSTVDISHIVGMAMTKLGQFMREVGGVSCASIGIEDEFDRVLWIESISTPYEDSEGIHWMEGSKHAD